MEKQAKRPKELKFVFNSPHNTEKLIKVLSDMCAEKIAKNMDIHVRQT